MGYDSYLKELLRPVCLYDLDDGPGSAELEALGAAMDALAAELLRLEAESIPATAEDEGLTRYEQILPYRPAAPNLTRRREAIMALLRIDDGSFTPDGLQDTIRGCGIAANVAESDTPQTVEVSFPGVRGEPANFAALKARVEEILPCHLDVVYVLVYMTWQDMEDYGLTWQMIETKQLTWAMLELYNGEVGA